MNRNLRSVVAQGVGFIALASICVSFAAASVRADVETSPIVIRYLNDRGYVPPYEIANALGLFNGKGIRLKSEEIPRADRKAWPRWQQAKST